jgi:CubicO group peptidase (beta-lactamase class C family)
MLTMIITGSAGWAGDAVGTTVCADAARQVATELEGLRRQEQVPAMGLAIFCNAEPVLISGHGNADVETPFRWGSITKSFTGLAGLRLTRTTAVDLDAPIRPILGPGYYRNPWAATEPVRLRHLLTLSAGLADLSRAEWVDNEPLPLSQALDRHQSDRRTHWPPGVQHSYTNVPPGLTAAVIEQRSGLPFDTFLQAQLFEPLGMKSASLDPVPGLPGGYRSDGITEIPYWHVTFRGFGALNATTSDMSRFIDMLISNGRLDGRRVLSEGLLEQFFTPSGTLGSAAGLEVGYGAGVYGWVRHGQLFHGHGGDADGYRSRYGLLRAHGRAYLVVINTDNPRLLGRMRRLLEQALTADLAPPAGPRPAADDLDAYSGAYYPSTARFDAHGWRTGKRSRAVVRRLGDRLTFEHNRSTITLHPAGEGRFFRTDDPAITVVFVRDNRGSLYLQGELGNFVRTTPGPCPDFLPLCD